MIKIKELKNIEDFLCLKKGDMVVCEFKYPIYDSFNQTYFFNFFKIVEHKQNKAEIILKKSNNLYFNYKMFIDNESHVKNISLIYQE